VTKVTVDLKHPIEAHGKTVSSLDLDEPTLGALDDIEITVKGDGSVRLNLGDLAKLVSNMAGIPPSAAKQIRASDVPVIAKAVMGFLPNILPTGGS
jgi:hypothetical protein